MKLHFNGPLRSGTQTELIRMFGCILIWVLIDSEPLSSDWINKLDKLLTDLL